MQLIKVQSIRDFGKFSPVQNIYIILLPSKIQGSLQKRSRKILRPRDDYKEIVFRIQVDSCIY